MFDRVRSTILLIAAGVLLLSSSVASAGVTKMTSEKNGVAANDFVDGGAVSRDGKYVLFNTRATNLGFDSSLMIEIVLRDLTTGALEVVSKTPSGVLGDGHSQGASISSGGRFLAFATSAINLKPGGGNGGSYDVVLHDRLLGTNELCSFGPGGVGANGNSFGASISGDGRYVAYDSQASNLVPGDINGMADVFRYDRVTKSIVRVNLTASGQDAPGFEAEPHYNEVISSDGRYVAFSSRLALGPEKTAAGNSDVWRKDLVTGAIVCVSMNAAGSATANGDSQMRDLTPDGRFVSFVSGASDLVASPSSGWGWYNIFVRDLTTGVTEVVSVRSDGTLGSAQCEGGSISSDGRYVSFASGSQDLALPIDTNNAYDVFLRDRALQKTERISLSTSGEVGNGMSLGGSVSDDGMLVGFTSYATNLDPTVTLIPGVSTETFLRHRAGFQQQGGGISGAAGIPVLSAVGGVEPGDSGVVQVVHAATSAPGIAIYSFEVSTVPFFGGLLNAYPAVLVLPSMTDALGNIALSYTMPPAPLLPKLAYLQVAVIDSAAPKGVALSNLLAVVLS